MHAGMRVLPLAERGERQLARPVADGEQEVRSLQAYILIQTEDHGALAPALMSIPGIVSAEDVNGPFDAIALAEAPSTRQLADEIIASIGRIPGVTRALPALLPKTLAGARTTGSGERAA